MYDLSYLVFLLISVPFLPSQDSIAITTLVDQTQSDKNLGMFRRKSCNPIKIRGAVGKHASVINGVYEPSLTELCGGWPVYYNNSSLKEEKSIGTKSVASKPNGINGSDDHGMGATKSFLLFCPYAMSWAITVLASVNDLTVSDEEELSVGMTVAAGSVSVVEASKALKEAKEKEREKEKEKEKVHVDGKATPASVTPRSLSAALSRGSETSPPSSSLSKSSAPTTPVKNSINLPFYTPSSAPLTLAFFEVSTNTQPELALGTATWKVLCGAQFEPQLAIKVTVVPDINAPTMPLDVGISLKTITKLKPGAIVVKSKPHVGSSQTALNLTQIGVKSVEKKPIQEVIPDSPVPSSSFTRSTRNPVSDKAASVGAISGTLGAKDAKKNCWQDRSIVMVGPDIAAPATQAVLRGVSSPGGKLSVPDSSSDDGVGVSNYEVEDEWLEVKQKRAKGSSGASNVSAVRAGMSTPSASTLKGSSSRSSSPTASPTPTNPATPSVTPSTPLINCPESFAAVLTAKKRDDGSASPPHPRFNPPNPPLGPSVQVPVVSTMGFKAAVMGGVLSSQPDPFAGSPSITSTYSSTTGASSAASVSQKETQSSQSARQSFSVDDFPAMPSSSSAQRLALAAPAPAVAVLAGAAFAAAAAVASINQSTAALSPLGTGTTPTIITDITAIGTSKKLPKMKKKAGKFGTESAVDASKESFAEEGNAGDNPRSVLVVEGDVAVDKVVNVDDVKTKLISGMTSSSVLNSSAVDPDISSSSCDSRSYSMPPLTATGADTVSSTYNQSTLNSHGPHTIHVTQGVYDTHSNGRDVDQGHLTGLNQGTSGIDRNALNGSDLYIHGHDTGTAHSTRITPHGRSNGQVDRVSPDTDEYRYMYHRPPKGDIDEDDEDLFKAISSANGIDFDPSFTANNSPRLIGSTLSPLSRRIGIRNELNTSKNNNNTIHNNNNNQSNIPRQSSSDNMRQSPYSSLLEPPGPPPIGPLSKAEGFLSGITFDLFSSLLQSNISEIAPMNMMRKDASILENISHINADVSASSHRSHRCDHSLPSSLEMMDLNNLQSGLSPLCNEYQYRGPLPEMADDQYDPDAHIARDIRYPMPALTPIPPSGLTNLTSHTNLTILNPSSSFNHVDSSHMNYPHRGTLELTRNLSQNLLSNLYNSPHSPPILFMARELSIATDNFSANNLINITESKCQSDIIVKTGRAKAILDKEKKELEKEREKELSMCTFVGLLRNNAVVIKIITPNTDSDINSTLQSQYLRELRVLCEVFHPNILPLFGYTFRPCARIYKIPSGIQIHDIYTDPASEIGVNGIKNSSSVGYYSLTCLLKNTEKRKKFAWKMRIRVIVCIVRALSYLHIGDCDAGRCSMAHW